MKKTVQLLVIFSFLLFNSVVWSHSPSNIKLEYDQKKGNLHIEMDHVSTSLREHRIRRLIVYKNDEKLINMVLTTQTSNSKVIEDVTVDAKAGDVIRIKAFCSEAGSGEAEITIP